MSASMIHGDGRASRRYECQLELWFEQPNKDEVLWDIPRLDSKANLKREDFAPPATPQGWKLVQQPRVARPSP